MCSSDLLYHPDATDDHGAYFAGTAADFIAWLPGILEVNIVTSHQVLNHLIAVDGDRAEGEVYVQAFHLADLGDGCYSKTVAGGRYLDRYERRDGHWKFSHRKIVADYEFETPAQAPADEHGSGTPRGGHGSADPSADFFTLI